MTAVSIIGIFLGLAVLIFCSMKGLSVFISALLASVVIALTGGISLESALLTDFMTGFVNFITGNFMVFAAGALMGKAYEITGGAKAVHQAVHGEICPICNFSGHCGDDLGGNCGLCAGILRIPYRG